MQPAELAAAAQQPAAYSLAETLMWSTQLKGCSNAQEQQQQRWSAALGLMRANQVQAAHHAAARGRLVDPVRWLVAGVGNAGNGVVPVALLLVLGPGGREAKYGTDIVTLSLDDDGFPLERVSCGVRFVQQFKSSRVTSYRCCLWVKDPRQLQTRSARKNAAAHAAGWVGLNTWLKLVYAIRHEHGSGSPGMQQQTAEDVQIQTTSASSAASMARGLAAAAEPSSSGGIGSDNSDDRLTSSGSSSNSITMGGSISSISSNLASSVSPAKYSSSSTAGTSCSADHLLLLEDADIYLLDILRQLSAPAEQLRRLKAALQRLRQLPPGSPALVVFQRHLHWVGAWSEAGCREEMCSEVQQLLNDVLAD
jgi:hypothetical protein